MNLRDNDHEHYLLTLYAPRVMRADVSVLMGFVHEIMAIRSRVRERQIGAIRLAWWRDFISTIYPREEGQHSNPSKSALAHHRGSHYWALHDQLAMVCRHHTLPPERLLAMVEIQLDAWENDYFANTENIWQFAATIEGNLTEMAAMVLGKHHVSDKTNNTLKQLGQIYGVTRMMSSIPERLPADKFAELIEFCRDRLVLIRPECGKLPKNFTPLRLMGLMTSRRLAHLQHVVGNIKAMKEPPSDPFLPIRMEIAAWRQKSGW